MLSLTQMTGGWAVKRVLVSHDNLPMSGLLPPPQLSLGITSHSGHWREESGGEEVETFGINSLRGACFLRKEEDESQERIEEKESDSLRKSDGKADEKRCWT